MQRTKRAYPHLLILSAFAFALCSALPAHATTITGVNVSDVTATSAVVTWKTDVNSDSTINYGLDTSFGLERDPSTASTAHSLTLSDLTSGTIYHFQVQSTDVQGNTGATGGYSFTTVGSPPSNVQQIVSAIKQLTNPQDILTVNQAIQQQAQSVLKPPTVLGQAKVVPSVNGADISWTTDRAAGSVVELEPDSTFDPSSSNAYSITQGDASESVTSHDVQVIGLDPNTEYHFIVSSPDTTGLDGVTADDTFTTKSTLPLILHESISNISETVATVNWSTGDVLASGNVDFTDERTHKTLTMGDPAFLDQHSVELTGLVFGTTYSVVIHATNQSGDIESSNPATFITVRDTTPPVISKVNNQSTLFPSDNVEVQTIITWETDKPAYCQLFYIHGVVQNASNPPTSQPLEANPLTDHTVVVVGLDPSSVYTYWIQCMDVANNPAQSDNYVLITPTKEKSIVDIILQNFQGTFGWVNNIGK